MFQQKSHLLLLIILLISSLNAKPEVPHDQPQSNNLAFHLHRHAYNHTFSKSKPNSKMFQMAMNW